MPRRRISNLGRHTLQARRSRLDRQNETEEQRKIRLAKNRKAIASKIEKETEEQRELRLSLNRIRQHKRYQKIKKLRSMTDTPTDQTQSMLESCNNLGRCSNTAAGNTRIRRNRKTTACKTAGRENQYRESEHIRFPVEFLNSLNATGIPFHKLILKVIPTNGKYFATIQHLLELEKPCFQDTSNELGKPKSNGTLYVENRDDPLPPLTVKIEGKEKPTIDVLAPPTLHTDIKEEPTYLIDPLREEFLNAEGEIIPNEPENDRDFDVEIRVKEEVEEEEISEQEELRRHKVFIVSQPAPVIEKEAVADPLQEEISPAVAGSSSFKPSISVRDIRTLTHNVPTPLTQPLKLRKVSRTEVLRAMKNNKPSVRVHNGEAAKNPIQKVKMKPPEKVMKPRIYRDILNRYLLKSKLPSVQSNNDSGNDFINQRRKRICVISVNISNQKNLSA